MIARRQGGFLIAKIHHLAGRIFSRLLKEHGIELNAAQGRIMFVLWQQDSMPISVLAKRTSLGKSTLTSMLDRLVVSGHIIREHSTRDRREILIRRTAADRELERTYHRVSKAMTGIFYTGLSDAKIADFEATLETILGNLVDHEERLSSGDIGEGRTK